MRKIFRSTLAPLCLAGAFALMLLGCAGTPSALAAPGKENPAALYTSLTPVQLLDIMRKDGCTVELKDDVVLWKIHNVNTVLALYDQGSSIQFYVGFNLKNVSLDTLNEWNRSKRYSRTFLDANGQPALQMDFDLATGVPLIQLQRFFATCETSLAYWYEEVIKPGAPGAAGAEPRPGAKK